MSLQYKYHHMLHLTVQFYKFDHFNIYSFWSHSQLFRTTDIQRRYARYPRETAWYYWNKHNNCSNISKILNAILSNALQDSHLSMAYCTFRCSQEWSMIIIIHTANIIIWAHMTNYLSRLLLHISPSSWYPCPRQIKNLKKSNMVK
jgi:hypothetical protein